MYLCMIIATLDIFCMRHCWQQNIIMLKLKSQNFFKLHVHIYFLFNEYFKNGWCNELISYNMQCYTTALCNDALIYD